MTDSNPSLCIPRIINNINEDKIRHVFNKLEIGLIHRIDIIAKKTEKGELNKRVYIHFNNWFNNEFANSFKNKIILGEEMKIVYDFPLFWKVSANKSRR
jgi:hypothetical protein